MVREMDTRQNLDRFLDTEPYWVIWQVAHAPGGERRIRRISQDYRTQAAAVFDADRFRKSGTVTWVEEARPLVPREAPAEAIEALGAAGPETDNIANMLPA